tara:strand:- start:16051 stop:16734 length:684 start_codon:yes stop_codon:yes gene_type:complete
VEEIDWSTGEILKALNRLKLSDSTIIIFTSDNGSNGCSGGSNAPLAGAKGSTMEGGMRVPMVVRWMGRIPAGTICNELTTTMDILPTFCSLADTKGPAREIDGHDISDLLLGKAVARSPYEAFYYYRRRQLQAVRMGSWKYHLELKVTHPRWTTPEVLGKGRPAKLVNLNDNLAENKDLSSARPDIVKKMKRHVARAMKELGNDDQPGCGQRPAKTLASSKPMLLPR